jgi:hypothetical protein
MTGLNARSVLTDMKCLYISRRKRRVKMKKIQISTGWETHLIRLIASPINAVILMWMWNIIMPSKFNLPHLGFLECWGLTIIANTIIPVFSPVGPWKIEETPDA